MSLNNINKKNKPIVQVVACLMPVFGIGNQGKLPWRLKKEMKYFKDVTMKTQDITKQNAVLMGRKTWLSIPPKFRPLPDRLNVVLSRSNPSWDTSELSEKGFVSCNDIKMALEKLVEDDNIERIYIIGGGEIYNTTYDYCSHLLITEISTEKDLEMDTFLNKSDILDKFTRCDDATQWKDFVQHSGYTEHEVEENDYKYSYVLYTKK